MQNVFKSFSGVARADRYHSGAEHHCTLDMKNKIQASCGVLIPRYGEAIVRRKNSSSLSFYENRNIKRIALEQQMTVKTPLGFMPAELVTFYQCGALKRFFPRDGQISGYWSEQDEEGLLEAVDIRLPFGSMKAKIIGCCFYESGKLKSITLWPTQTIHADTGFGSIAVRHGLSFYENGAIRSLEPAYPTTVSTPIGLLKAYDAAAVGINADFNSLAFDESGRVCALIVPSTIFKAVCGDRTDTIEPVMSVNPLDGESLIELPVRVRFTECSVYLSVNGQQREYDLQSTQFTIEPKKRSAVKCAGGNCAACGLCAN